MEKATGLAKELIREPDLLLLDEPTNHLDLEGILWLEKFLLREAPTYLLVSHDRYFLQNVTNRIIEIDSVYPRGIFAIDGPYAEFLARKEEFLEGQIQQERSLASKTRREEEWLSRSAKARTTKSQSRIDEAQELLGELSQIRKEKPAKKAGVDFVGSERETRKLLTAKNLAKEISAAPFPPSRPHPLSRQPHRPHGTQRLWQNHPPSPLRRRIRSRSRAPSNGPTP